MEPDDARDKEDQAEREPPNSGLLIEGASDGGFREEKADGKAESVVERVCEDGSVQRARAPTKPAKDKAEQKGRQKPVQAEVKGCEKKSGKGDGDLWGEAFAERRERKAPKYGLFTDPGGESQDQEKDGCADAEAFEGEGFVHLAGKFEPIGEEPHRSVISEDQNQRQATQDDQEDRRDLPKRQRL